MQEEFALAKGLAAVCALLWLVLIALGILPPEGRPFLSSARLTPRVALVGAVGITAMFPAIAVLEGRPWILMGPTPPRLDGPWGSGFVSAMGTLSAGALFLVISVLLVALATGLGGRSRIAARWVAASVVLLLVGALWLPEPGPAAVWSRLDQVSPSVPGFGGWSRFSTPVAPWGALLALGGVGIGISRLRGATRRGDAAGREAACAAIACCGLVVAGLTVVEAHKWVEWKAWSEIRVCVAGMGEGSDPSDLSYYGGASGWRWAALPPVVPRPFPLAAIATLGAAGVLAALFGEFHLRGRRVVRKPFAPASERARP
jgi:hypothetical protein